MTQLEKLIERLRNARGGCSVRDIERLLIGYGWEPKPGKGSHIVFKKAGAPNIVVPTVHGRDVKRVYLADILRRLGIE